MVTQDLCSRFHIQSWERTPGVLQARTLGRLTAGWLSALILLAATSVSARAAEARPWLCRDKPVFSTSGPSRLDLSSHDSRRWQLFLMQFDPSGGHDGFTVTNSYALGPGNRQATDNLTGGRFFAVALYNSGGHWICSGPARDERTSGTIANLCYSTGGGGCDVNLAVRSVKESRAAAAFCGQSDPDHRAVRWQIGAGFWYRPMQRLG